jgi:hypothetical protein
MAQEISSIYPASLQPGKTTAFTIHGSGLDTVREAWSSFGGFVSTPTHADAKEMRIDLSCPADTPLGIYPFHLAGDKGISNWTLLMVDDLETISATGDNRVLEQAQLLPVPSACEGALKPDAAAFYRWEAKANQSYSIEIVAQRLGSPLDPVLSISDSDGKTVASINDEAGIGADCRLSFVPAKDGVYFIKLHDTGFAGGSSYRYRLRLGRFPLATVTFPLVLDRATIQAGNFQLRGPRVGQAKLMTGRRFAEKGETFATTELAGEMPGSRSFMQACSSAESWAREAEPNNTTAEANRFELPFQVCGELSQNLDRDHYRFKARAGQRLFVKTQTRSLGAPCDLQLKLLSGGEIVAQSDPGDPNEADLSYTPKVDGELCLSLAEITGLGSPLAVYAVSVAVEKSGFELSCDKDSVEIAPGKSGVLKISAKRFGEPAAISLSAEGFGEGITVENAIIPKDKNETELKFTLSQEWKPGQAIHFKINGSMAGTPPEQSGRASSREALKKPFPLMLNPPLGLDGLFSLAIIRE